MAWNEELLMDDEGVPREWREQRAATVALLQGAVIRAGGDPKGLTVVGLLDELSEQVLVAVREAATLRKKAEEADMLAAELIGALGLDREAIDRSGEPVGNAILRALREDRPFRASFALLEAENRRLGLALGEAQLRAKLLESEVERLRDRLATLHSARFHPPPM
jgi:hypothetical protein